MQADNSNNSMLLFKKTEKREPHGQCHQDKLKDKVENKTVFETAWREAPYRLFFWCKQGKKLTANKTDGISA
ncbi:hypothetical protein AB4Z29_05150 [Paenibacillus sp. 2TAB23]|uniref:hypothetical protein n=1 Tax=Paenibacillus sp. 2TAB23 TaxID=3233004 RepID=UPI003F97C5B6